MTTRRRDAALDGHRRRRVEVDVFTPAEALAYRRYWPSSRTCWPASRSWRRSWVLLPVALAQAGAYRFDR
ncbi:hypothetical protein [Kutzneria kofuensis]|uniref:hypothetical protein n=1 Tax=Kutzneria kofuensis TaxID=103725 RepID=UPI0031E6315E